MLGAAALAIRPSAVADRGRGGGRGHAGGGDRGCRRSTTSSSQLPGFDAANNGRFAVIAVLCLAVLAGWGLDELTAGRIAARAASCSGPPRSCSCCPR